MLSGALPVDRSVPVHRGATADVAVPEFDAPCLSGQGLDHSHQLVPSAA